MLAVVGTFPERQFVREVTRDYFERGEYLVHEPEDGVIEARNPGSGENWVCICLGDLDKADEFDAVLGRLIKTMRLGDCNYAIAGPATSLMYHHVSRVAPEIRQTLRLHYLIVDENAEVRTDTQYID